jgi:hypothetical protein
MLCGVLADHFLNNEARAAGLRRRRTKCVVLIGAALAAGLLITGCNGTLSGGSLPTRSPRATPAAAASTPAAAATPAATSSSGSSLIWLWVALGVLAIIIIAVLIARSGRRKPKAADVWRSRALDAYAQGAALYDAMQMAEAPGALIAPDAAARWADIQRRADDLGQALYAMREAAPDEDKRMRTADVLAALQAVRTAMAAERGTDVSQVPPPEQVRSRLQSFRAALQGLREPDDRMPY